MTPDGGYIRASASATVTLPAVVVFTVVNVIDAEVFSLDTSTGILTVLEAGVYEIVSQIQGSTSLNKFTVVADIQIEVGGSWISQTSPLANTGELGAGGGDPDGRTVVRLTANQRVRVSATGTGSSIERYNNLTMLQAYKIGE